MNEPDEFRGRHAWVTGAGRGIGAAIADRLSAAGVLVTGIDLAFPSAPAGNTLHHAVPLDIADAQAVQLACDRLLADRAAPDFLVCAAGVLHVGGVADLAVEDWQRMLAVNAGGAFLLLRRLVPVFQRRGSGGVVIVASNAATVPRLDMAGYCASKAALLALARCAALELAPSGVRCNVVSPGSTDTPMQHALWTGGNDAQRMIEGTPGAFRLGIPLGKIARPDDVADAVMFLLSDRAGHVAMQNLVLDGGATLGAG